MGTVNISLLSLCAYRLAALLLVARTGASATSDEGAFALAALRVGLAVAMPLAGAAFALLPRVLVGAASSATEEEGTSTSEEGTFASLGSSLSEMRSEEEGASAADEEGALLRVLLGAALARVRLAGAASSDASVA